MIPSVSTRIVIHDYELYNAVDRKEFEDSVKRKLVAQLADSLIDKVEFSEYKDPSNHEKTIQANLIAMSYEDFQANYGSQIHRRGISDGTMAIMQNGHWKVLGHKPLVKPVVDEKPKVEYNKKSAVDYLTERMRNS